MEFGININLSGTATLTGVGPLPPFSPSDIAGLKLWLKADGSLWQDSGRTVVAAADGDPVGAWDDSSGNANHLMQITATKRPTLKTAIVNGNPVIRLDGIDDVYRVDFTLNQPHHNFLMLAQRSWAQGRFINAGSVGSAGMLYQHAVTPNIRQHSGIAGTENSGLVIGQYRLVEAFYSGASSSLIIAGGTAVISNVGTNNPGGVTLGGETTAANFSSIDVAEMLIYNSQVTGSNLTNLRSYFLNKYGAL